MNDTSTPDDRPEDPTAAQEADLATGMSDDPRVDPTPDRRQSDGAEAAG